MTSHSLQILTSGTANTQMFRHSIISFLMWQYSSSGKVDGIEGDVDMNICFTNIADYD